MRNVLTKLSWILISERRESMYILQISRIPEKCAYSRYRRCPDSRERASQSYEIVFFIGNNEDTTIYENFLRKKNPKLLFFNANYLPTKLLAWNQESSTELRSKGWNTEIIRFPLGIIKNNKEKYAYYKNRNV